ncbi:hypothetical protein Y032_0090g2332 [Ancylostoma ceylanicum]|uniref:Nucleotide-diphospho-sugar transferase domain-containing protein n=1 Tax=Ancylostoma ceylanicum TaxID=53326 RepID=A0A016TMP0_9BILA|nr:hypothetical protein Y032_0090g2332 [Ancylostoma ceylanicum]
MQIRHRRVYFIRSAAVFTAIVLSVYCISSTIIPALYNNPSYLYDDFLELEKVTRTNGWLRKQSKSSSRIAIVMVVLADTKMELYASAALSVLCYSKVQNYEFRILNASHFKSVCSQKDGFFQRHCIVASILPLFDYILYLDADIGVVNPKRRVEEYLDIKADIVFYDRFYNWEISAGSYLVKNTKWSQDFLYGFANYVNRLPNSFHGTDNGALHAYVAETVLPNNNSDLNICMEVYKNSKNYWDLFLYEACIRNILQDNSHLGKIRILHKGTAWARDNWITNNFWSEERDFMIHGWKENQLQTYKKKPVLSISKFRSNWYNPLAGPIHLSLCTKRNVSWRYDENLITTKEEIDNLLHNFSQEVERAKAAVLQSLPTLSPKIGKQRS